MMKKSFLGAILLCLMLAPAAVFAQLTLSGEFRPRAEYMDGYKTLRDSSSKPYPVISMRARLGAQYTWERLTGKFVIQDAFTWGENNFSTDTIKTNTLNIFEAWLKWNITDAWSIRAGRQDLNYDDGRLISSINWRQWGATHDVAIISYTKDQLKADIGMAINNMAPASAYRVSYNQKNYKYLSYLYLKHGFLKNKLQVSLLGVVDAFQKPALKTKVTKTTFDTVEVRNANDSIIGTAIIPQQTTTTLTTTYPNTHYARYTFGPNIRFEWNWLKAGGSFFYQGGKLKDGRDIHANFYSFFLGVKPFSFLELLAVYDHYSGSDLSDTTEIKKASHAFSNLYGSGHTFLGYMDYFSHDVSETTKGAGVNDLFFRISVFLKEKHRIEVTSHFYYLDQSYLPDPVTKFRKAASFLGSEYDLVYTYSPRKDMDVQLGYCFMQPSQSMEYLKGIGVGKSKFPQWAYLMVTWKPVFFKSDK